MLRICKLADEQRVDALTCGGDLYEQERFTPDTAEFLRSTFAEPDPVALVVEATSPSNAWVDRLVKPDAYARMDSSPLPGPPEGDYAREALPYRPGPRRSGHRHPLPAL